MGNEITIENILQELLHNEFLETIDKEARKGHNEGYEIKLKYEGEEKVAVEHIKELEKPIITYTLYPHTYTQEEKIDILFKVEGKVKSITKPDGLIIYPKQEIVAMDYYVTSNGEYKFIVEKEDGSKEEKNVIVDTIDKLPPREFEITTEKTRTGIKINAKTQDIEANETSVKSGIRKYEYYIKLSTQKDYKKYDINEINNLPDGIYDVYVIAYDKAGNTTISNTVTQEVEVWIEIWNEQDLRDIENNPTRNHIVMADIEVQNEWNAICRQNHEFNAKLEGNGHKITGITINKPNLNEQGLFARIGKKGEVSNLELECNIVARMYIGGIAGLNYGTIKGVKVNGVISGTQEVGGVVGYNTMEGIIEMTCNMTKVTADERFAGGIAGLNYGTISKAVNIGAIKGKSYVGGIVGTSDSYKIVNAYSIGSITVTESNGLGGGIAGMIGAQGGITNTYSISEIIGSGNKLEGIGNASSNAYIKNSYFAAERAKISRTDLKGISTTIKWLTCKENLEGIFDFENVWDIKDGETLPYLRGMPIPNEVYVEKQGYITMDGEGTSESPYLITTEEQLKNMNYYLTSYFKLINDIELKNEWKPISAYNSSMSWTYWAFNGNFDGNGHKISNLIVNNENSDYQGIFGYIATRGKIQNLELECNIKGKRSVGGIAGKNLGTIVNVKVEGVITGDNNVGGIAGESSSTISKAYSTAEVTGNNDYVGGIVGNNAGTIEKSINNGNIIGKNGVGGIAGSHRSTNKPITDSYSLGNISGTGFTGGIAGYNTGSIINTYSLSKISNVHNARGLIGSNTGTVTSSYWTVEKAEVEDKDNGGTAVTLEQMKQQETYEGWDFDNVWIMKEYPELR